MLFATNVLTSAMDYFYLIGTCVIIFLLINFLFKSKTIGARIGYTFAVIFSIFLIFAGIMYVGWNYGNGGNGGRHRPPEFKYIHVVNTGGTPKYVVLGYMNDINKKISDTLYMGEKGNNNTAVFELPISIADSSFLNAFSLDILDSAHNAVNHYTEAEFLKRTESMPKLTDKRKADLWVLEIK